MNVLSPDVNDRATRNGDDHRGFDFTAYWIAREFIKAARDLGPHGFECGIA